MAFTGTLPTSTKQTFLGFFFLGSDPAGFPNSFRCALDGGALSICPSSHQVGPLATGSHTIVVFNQTGDGRTSPVLTHGFFVDATLPTVTAPKVPKVSLGGPARVTWTATDAAHRHPGLRRGVLEGRAGRVHDRVDAAARVETSWPRPRCGCRRLLPASPSASPCGPATASATSRRGPHPAAHSGRTTTDPCGRAPDGTEGPATPYWKGTITTTTGVDKTLRRLDVHLNQVGLLATVCPTCGKVDVSVGGTRIRRVSLERTTTTHQKVLLLPAFAATTGTVTITSVTTGKSIRIDGLITARTTDTVPPT